MEGLFALKLASKHLLPREVINDIMRFCGNIHSIKLECISSLLVKNFEKESNVEIEKVADVAKLHDNVLGLKDKLLTDYKREKYFKENFDFIEPQRLSIKIEEVEVGFLYSLPIKETLTRLLADDSLRRN